MKKIVKLLLLNLAILLAFISCGEKTTKTKDGLPILRVAVMPFLNSIPIKYIQEHKLDIKNGFKIETVYFPTGGSMNEALAGEQWDVGTLSAASVFSLANYNAHIIADVAHSEGGIETLVASDSDILKIKGYNPEYPEVYGNATTLKGKKIGVTPGTISELNVNEWLKSINVKPEDVQIVGMDFPQALQALIAKKIDIAALNPPTSFEAENRGFKTTSSLVALKIPQFDSIVVSDNAYNTKKDLLVKYIKTFYEANDALQNDSNMAAELLLKWYTQNGSKSDLIKCKDEIKNRPFVTSTEAKKLKMGDSVIVTAKFFADKGKIEKEKINIVKKNVDTSLIKEALK